MERDKLEGECRFLPWDWWSVVRPSAGCTAVGDQPSGIYEAPLAQSDLAATSSLTSVAVVGPGGSATGEAVSREARPKPPAITSFEPPLTTNLVSSFFV